MADEVKVVDPALAGLYEAMEKTNAEKIVNETLAGISENSSDSESFNVERRNEDAKDRPWRPSHVVFGKSTIKQGQIDAMRGRYFRDISIMRAKGENNVPLPEGDEVVVYRSFIKAGLRFPLDKLLVEVLKTFEIYLHQLTPEAIIKVGIFLWAMRSQGLEPDARCFCNIFMSCRMRRRLPETSSITTTLVVTASCLGASVSEELPNSHISEEMASVLDAGMVLHEE
jgi:hypothetical protein